MKTFLLTFVFILTTSCLASVSNCFLKSQSYKIAKTLPVKFIAEPSGIVFHPIRKSLFVVSDEGNIYEISTIGKKINQRNLGKYDLEGITVNPISGKLYIAVEGSENILQVNAKSLKIEGNTIISRLYKGKIVLAAGGQGIEAITFIPNLTNHNQSNLLIANQGAKKRVTNDLPAIFSVGIPSNSTKKISIANFMPLKYNDLSGLHYLANNDHILLISDTNDLIFEYSRPLKLIMTTKIPGENQEGITIDDKGNIYIAQDSGGIIIIE